jgi:hypothetical protein
MLPSALPRIMIAERREKTAPSSDLRVQELVATIRGALIDLAWRAPDFDPAARQLVGFELFRDDVSTQPPSRLTVGTMPRGMVGARNLEILPHSEYGVQAIWRVASTELPALIEFGPPRLTKDLAGPAIFLPPEERIHSLAFLQRQGAITSEELDLAVETFLGRAQPALEADAMRPAAALGVGAAGASPSRARRLAFTYIAIAVVMILVLVAAEQLIGRLLAQPTAANVATSTPSAQPSPSAEPSASPSPTAVVVDLHSILIKPTDLRPGYIAGQYSSRPLCSACVPELSSLSLAFQNAKLKRTILTAASVAPSTADSKAVATALMAFRSDPRTWVPVGGLGDEGYATSTITPDRSQNRFYVVWRSGVMTNEIMLVAPAGILKTQNAIDLAKIQQARAAKVLA